VKVQSLHGMTRPLLGSPNKATTSSAVRPTRSFDFNCSSLGNASAEKQYAKRQMAKRKTGSRGPFRGFIDIDTETIVF
jgi:hypothetical protein